MVAKQNMGFCQDRYRNLKNDDTLLTYCQATGQRSMVVNIYVLPT